MIPCPTLPENNDVNHSVYFKKKKNKEDDPLPFWLSPFDIFKSTDWAMLYSLNLVDFLLTVQFHLKHLVNHIPST